MKRLCTKADVERILDITGRWSDDEINAEIESQTEDIYNECGYPIASCKFDVGLNSLTNIFYKEYFLGEPYIYGVDRVFVGTTTKRELEETADYSVAKKVGMIKLNSSTVGGLVLDDSDDFLVYYVPTIYARYCAIKVAEALLEKVDIISNGQVSKQLDVVREKRKEIECLISQRLGVMLSSSYDGLNLTYTVQKKVRQDHDKNIYLWKVD